MTSNSELTVYAALWCPHCQRTVAFLSEHGIPFQYVDIEKAAPEVVQTVIDKNGGDDWVVPTLEYHGKWRPGKFFNAEELISDLKELGVPFK